MAKTQEAQAAETVEEVMDTSPEAVEAENQTEAVADEVSVNETGKKIKSSKLNRREKTGYLFVIPYVITFCIFSIYPVVKTFTLSLSQYKGGLNQEPVFVGLEKYIMVLQDNIFWDSLINTAKIWGVNIVLQLGLAFLLTIIFSDVKYKIRGIGFYRAVYYLPNIIAVTSIAYLFQTLLHTQHGSINKMLTAMAGKVVAIPWMESADYSWIVISVIQAWMWFGNSFIMLMAGVMGISRDYYEAAAIDGAGRWKLFTKITLPLLKPIMLYVGVTSLIGGLQMFDLPQIMFSKASSLAETVRTVVMNIYRFGFGTFDIKDVGRAAAMAYVLFVIILFFSVLQFVLMRNKEED